ncbi:MAG: hypothetical protein CSB49_06595 [Proteobacteria bacterium]|nr:MAG: hypothetical protein CSB49_06595 [Pseudomonadota bacterium]
MSRSLLLAFPALLLALPAGEATAGPLSKSGVIVADDGTVLIDGQRAGKLKLPAGQRALQVERSRGARRALIGVHVVAADGRAASLVRAKKGGTTKTVFNGPTGPQGVDGDWSLHLELRGGQLLRYQRRPGFTRCDGAPALLFPQVYDFRGQRFRSVVLPPKGSTLRATLTAKRLGATPTPAMSTFRPVAASTQLGDGGHASELSAPLELTDGHPERPWIEGRSSDGRGEWVTLRRGASPYTLRALRIVPGNASSPAAFASHNRLASVIVALSAKRRYRVRFPRDPLLARGDVRTPYEIVLPEPSDTRCITVVIEAVYPAKGGPRRGGRTAIGELRAVTDLAGAAGRARLLADLQHQDEARARAAINVLALQGDAALPLLAKPLMTARRGSALLSRLLIVLGRLRSPKAAALAAGALPRLGPRGRRLLQELLRGLGHQARPTLEWMLRGEGDPGAVMAAQLLARLASPAARKALLAQTGARSRARRAAVAAAIGAQRDLVVVKEALAALQATPLSTQTKGSLARRADLVLVLGRLGRRLTAGRRATLAAELRRGWPEDDADATFELRYRLIRALGQLDGPGLRAWLLKRSQGRRAVLRWQAVLALARDPDDAVTSRLVAALRDSDPRVRASAAQALASRRAAGVSKALQEVLRYEGWPMVARAAAAALGQHCSPATDRALRRAIAKRALGIDVAALGALARCRPANLFDTLLTYAMSRMQPLPLRRRAIGLLDRALVGSRARIIASLFLRLRRAAASSAAAEQVAAAFARALGRVGSGVTAGRPLRDALALDPSVAIRSAAARALGQVCWIPSVGALRRALADPAPAVRRSARDAIHSCRRNATAPRRRRR